jgi:hypothetical protein
MKVAFHTLGGNFCHGGHDLHQHGVGKGTDKVSHKQHQCQRQQNNDYRNRYLDFSA